MKLKLLLFLISLLVAIDGFGQSKSVSVPVYKSGDTTGYYGIQRERIAQMKMRDPLVSKDSLTLLLSSDNWAVEIHTNDFKAFTGKQYFFTRKIVREGKIQSLNSENDLLFSVKPIKKSQARAIYEAFTERSIASIPNELDIRKWGMSFDGISYSFEYATPASYTLKNYSNPSNARYHVKEAAAIDDFIREIETKLGLSKSFLVFLNKLPPGTYHTGGITAYNNTGKKRKAAK